MIRITLFCTLRESKNLRPCENVRFSHGSRFFDSHNIQKRATKSDTLGTAYFSLENGDVDIKGKDENVLSGKNGAKSFLNVFLKE